MSKVIDYREAAKLVKDGDVVAVTTFGLGGLPEQMLVGIKERYAEEKHPANITFMSSCGIGNGQPGRGADHLLEEGLMKRAIMGHVGSSPGMVQAIIDNKYETYLMPQGVFTQYYRTLASRKPYLSRVGLNTYVDPRIEGCKATTITTEDIVSVVEIAGKEYLHYHPVEKIDVGVIRGTWADEFGNLVVDRETCKLEQLELATAARNTGGIVIAQVEGVVQNGSLDPTKVLVPGALVDYIIVAEPIYHFQTMITQYNPAFSNQIRIPATSASKMPLNTRKIMARRAAMELSPNSIINLGIGTPDGVAVVAVEEGVANYYTATLEMGLWGGTPTGGGDFGGSVNAQAAIGMAGQFDFYDGGGLDLTVLGIGEIDQYGNNNVTKFGPKVPGPGGFVNISQNTKKIVFVGTLTVGGKAHIEDGKLVIDNQGKGPKFIKEVQQISFSGKYATENKQEILYVTERAVFDLHEGKVRLIEYAPGVDVEKDILAYMDFKPEIAEDLKMMNPDIFKEEWGGLKAIIESKAK